jgi:hypothetical protein
MARLLKNPDLSRSGTTAAKLPIVPSGSLGDAPTDGLIRFNQATNRIDFYYNNAWNQVAKIGTVPIAIDGLNNTLLTVDGQNQYTMSYNYTNGQENNVLVFVGGVQQQANVNYHFSYSVSTNQIYITPSTSGDAGQPILIIHNINSTNVPA